MAKTQWVRVKNHSPCPVCKGSDWCCVSSDGAVAKCMRIESGCFRSKEDSSGGRYFLHRQSEGPRRGADLPQQPGPEAKRADVATLHEVYSALVQRLVLSQAHHQALLARGLDDAAITRACYRTLPGRGRSGIVRELMDRFGENLLRVPGFVIKETPSGRYPTLRGSAGLLVPCRDLEGRIIALKIRRDEVGAGASRYHYLSSSGHGGPGSGSPVHVPLGTTTSAGLVRITEGELKADVIQALTQLPTISVPGVGNWRAALAVLKGMGCRTARLAFDADSSDKPSVARALIACADALREAGFAVELEQWDIQDGKGLDDLLASGKLPRVLEGDEALQTAREILATATAEEEPAPADELLRLQEVLDAKGAEGLFRDKPLMQALADLAANDPAGFAAEKASIRTRVSLRDLDKALAPFRRAGGPTDGVSPPLYFEQGGSIHRSVQTKEGPLAIPLCNFSARITEDLIRDDGADRICTMTIQGALGDGTPLPGAEVAAGDFAGMGWIVPAWGTRAIVHAGIGTKDHLRAALQVLSGNIPRRVIYGHIGWRKIGDVWVYLHGAGAIGADGNADDIPVSLPQSLDGFRLPAPGRPVSPRVGLCFGELGASAQEDMAALKDAVRASLGLVRVGVPRVAFPLLAAPYRAVLGNADFALHLSGPTGCFKSEAAALAQQHFGAEMDARHLPANWSSTGNALEALAFVAKDALLVVDDFCPTGSSNDVQRYHKEADRLFRGQGNHAGRQRLKADASLRPAKAPRGLTLSTGEDVPRGQSLRARLLILEISPGDLGPLPPQANPSLSACQADAAAGKYAAALAGFICWLAPRYDTIRESIRSEMVALRDQARTEGQHARTPGIIADLALGLRYLLDFAREIEAITEVEKEDLWQRGWAALNEAGASQNDQLATAEPAGQFLRLLSAAIASGSAHLADEVGNPPEEPQRWGWRPEEFSVGDGETHTRFRPQGVRVGWLVDGEVYLEPDAGFATVQELARDQGESFAITSFTLRRRLKEKGFLATTDEARGKLLVRRTLQGSRRDVLHLTWHAWSAPGSGETPDDGKPKAGPETWADSTAEREQRNDNSRPENRDHTPVKKEVGRLGRSEAGEGTPLLAEHSTPQPADWGDWQ